MIYKWKQVKNMDIGEDCVVIAAWFSYTSPWDLFPQLLGNNQFKIKVSC